MQLVRLSGVPRMNKNMINSTVSRTAGDWMTRFERGVVFRVARGCFFALAVFAVLMFIGGIVVGIRGLAFTPVPQPELPPAPPPRQELTLEAAKAELKNPSAAEVGLPSLDVEALPPPGTRPDPEDTRLAAAVSSLQGLFPDPPYKWETEIEKVCSVPTSFGCLQWGNQVKRYGASVAVGRVFYGMDRSEAADLFTVVRKLLSTTPIEQRLSLVRPIVIAEMRARAAHEAAVDKHKRRVADIESAYDLEVAVNKARHEGWKQQGLYAMGAGFSLLISVSLFLAFLSMERHTRALEGLAFGSLPQAGRRGGGQDATYLKEP